MPTFPPSPTQVVSADEIRALHGRVVLVKSSRDQRNPPTAMRGSIEVTEAATAPPRVSIALEFPQMFASKAHHRSIPLDDSALARLLASENEGALAITIDDDLT